MATMTESAWRKWAHRAGMASVKLMQADEWEGHDEGTYEEITCADWNHTAVRYGVLDRDECTTAALSAHLLRESVQDWEARVKAL